jgi:DNA modification methylase
MVWVCEFQYKNESAWAYVVATKREATRIGNQLGPTMKKVKKSEEFKSLNDNEYQIYKTEHYYFGA